MSDTQPRTVGGPPPRGTGPSTLIKALRPAAPVVEDATGDGPDGGEAPTRTVAAPPPRAPRPQAEAVAAVAAPAVPVNPYMAPPAVEPERPAAPAAADAAVPAQATPSVKKKDPPKITIKTSEARRNRLRATFLATRDLEDELYVTELVEKAIDAECARREQLYNGGQPFPGGDRALPRGRAFQ